MDAAQPPGIVSQSAATTSSGCTTRRQTESVASDAVERIVLTRHEAAETMRGILRGEQSPEEIKRFLLGYNSREATADELGGFLSAVREAATIVELPSDVAARAIDIVGTGGDNSGSYNVSTLAALIVASCGVPVAKHGNRALSSKSGAADILTALGVKVGLDPEGVSRRLPARLPADGALFRLHHRLGLEIGRAHV